VRTIDAVVRHLEGSGNEVRVFGPDRFPTLPCPTYPEIPLALFPSKRLTSMLEEFAPEAIHLATEGPLGWAGRTFCLKRQLPFTTAYHTRFPEYVYARTRIPLAWTYAVVRRFHSRSSGVLVVAPTIRRELRQRGFSNLVPWSLGVDTNIFRPQSRLELECKRPIWLYAGRVAIEKNIKAFLNLDLPGSKWVAGGGPELERLKKRHGEVHFLGFLDTDALAQRYAQADCLVFPSVTDTFGLVMIEALASGVPVAAYPVSGPREIVTDPRVGALNPDLRTACLAAIGCHSEDCRRHAERFSWANCAQQFSASLHVIATAAQSWQRTVES